MDESSAEVSRVWEALRRVQEPELHKDIVALEMVKDVNVRDQRVSLTFTLTTPACPLKEEIETSIRPDNRNQFIAQRLLHDRFSPWPGTTETAATRCPALPMLYWLPEIAVKFLAGSEEWVSPAR